jgi:hypothetical protein
MCCCRCQMPSSDGAVDKEEEEMSTNAQELCHSREGGAMGNEERSHQPPTEGEQPNHCQQQT